MECLLLGRDEDVAFASDWLDGKSVATNRRWRRASRPRTAIIHVGFEVKDYAAEDKFYRDLLGFHELLAWIEQKDGGETDYMSLQSNAFDGTDCA